MKILRNCIIAFLLVAAPASAAPPIFYPSVGELPFSEAVQVGDMLYLSGQIGVAPGDNKLAEGGIEGQTRQTMENIKATLNRQGLGFKDVVKCTVMLANMADWPAFNRVYTSYFPDKKYPARSAFGSSGLAYGGAIELECWAYNPKGNPDNQPNTRPFAKTKRRN